VSAGAACRPPARRARSGALAARRTWARWGRWLACCATGRARCRRRSARRRPQLPHFEHQDLSRMCVQGTLLACSCCKPSHRVVFCVVRPVVRAVRVAGAPACYITTLGKLWTCLPTLQQQGTAGTCSHTSEPAEARPRCRARAAGAGRGGARARAAAARARPRGAADAAGAGGRARAGGPAARAARVGRGGGRRGGLRRGRELGRQRVPAQPAQRVRRPGARAQPGDARRSWPLSGDQRALRCVPLWPASGGHSRSFCQRVACVARVCGRA